MTGTPVSSATVERTRSGPGRRKIGSMLTSKIVDGRVCRCVSARHQGSDTRAPVLSLCPGHRTGESGELLHRVFGSNVVDYQVGRGAWAEHGAETGWRPGARVARAPE